MIYRMGPVNLVMLAKEEPVVISEKIASGLASREQHYAGSPSFRRKCGGRCRTKILGRPCSPGAGFHYQLGNYLTRTSPFAPCSRLRFPTRATGACTSRLIGQSPDVRFGSLADVGQRSIQIRSAANNGHSSISQLDVIWLIRIKWSLDAFVSFRIERSLDAFL
jgi:hypothetical protein